jgi:hypothetical protein
VLLPVADDRFLLTQNKECRNDDGDCRGEPCARWCDDNWLGDGVRVTLTLTLAPWAARNAGFCFADQGGECSRGLCGAVLLGNVAEPHELVPPKVSVQCSPRDVCINPCLRCAIRHATWRRAGLTTATAGRTPRSKPKKRRPRQAPKKRHCTRSRRGCPFQPRQSSWIPIALPQHKRKPIRFYKKAHRRRACKPYHADDLVTYGQS